MSFGGYLQYTYRDHVTALTVHNTKPNVYLCQESATRRGGIYFIAGDIAARCAVLGSLASVA